MSTVLLVDDDADILRLAYRLFSRAGFDVVTAADGELGWDRARQHHPDAIVTDQDMPYRTGLQLCAAVRSDTHLHRTPVVLYTGGTHPGDLRLVHAPVCAVLTKPCPTDRLITTVRDLCRQGPHDHPGELCCLNTGARLTYAPS